MAGLIISSGITSSGLVIVSKLGGSSYNSMTILDGGTASDTMVSAAGRLFLSSGGMASSTTVNGGYMLVSSGGTADDLVIGPSGNLSVFAGGSAINVTENGGFVLIENGAVVTFVPNTISGLIVGSWRTIRSATVHSGTTITDVTLESGSLSVFDGGIVSNTIVGYNCSIILSSGGKLTGHHVFNTSSAVSATSNSIFDFDLTHLSPEATALVNNLSAVQGTPTYTLTVDSNVAPGFYFLAEGVSQFNQSVIVVDTDGTDLGILSLDTTVLIDGIDYTLSLYDTTLCLSVGGAPRPKQFEGVELQNVSKTVHEGETYNNTTILSSGELVVSSGGVVNNTVVNSWGDLSVLGGVANDTIVNSSGSILIASGGIANTINVQSRGNVEVYDGGTANSITLDEYAWLNIYDGIVDNVSVNKGYLYIEFGGGTATNIDWTPCEGRVEYRDDAYVTFVSKYSGVYYGTSNQLLSHVQLFESKSLGSSDIMYVMSGGTASYISGSGSGWYEISIWDGGVINNAVINRGMVEISSGGIVNDISIQSGDIWISSGGWADGVSVNASSWLIVESGGTATNVLWTPCVGTIEIYNDACVTFAPGQHSGVYYGANQQLLSNTMEMSTKTIGASASMFVMQDGVAKQTTVNGSGSLYVYENGLAEGTIVNTNGGLRIASGGTVTQTTISGGWGTVAKGGSASNATLNNSGRLYVENGGRATDIVINSGGSISVSSGGTATIINASSGAYIGLTVAPDTYAQGTYNGSAFEVKNAFISGVTIAYGSIQVSSGGSAESVTLNKGWFYSWDGGVANNTTINGGWFSIRGGEARNTTVNSGGSVGIYSGGKLTGKAFFNNGAKISAYDGGVLDFDLTQITPGESALVNNLSLVQGTPEYTLTVDGTQENGNYILAEGASGFNSTITVVNRRGEHLGNLNIGTTLTVSFVDYTLSLNESALILSVREEEPVISNGVVVSGGTRIVNAGEMYQETFVDSGGFLEVTSGGRTKNTQIGSSSYQYYDYDWSYSGDEDPALGHEIVSSGGYAEGTVAFNGYQEVYGLASGTILSSAYCDYWDYYYWPSDIRGGQNVNSGGTAVATRINSGAQGIASSGLAIDTIVTYGYQYIASGGVARNTTLNGGSQYIANGGIASGNIINGGWHYVSAGGSVCQEIMFGGNQYFSGFGSAIDVRGGYLLIDFRGSVQDVQLHSGASICVSGGSVTNLVQESGGHIIINFQGGGFVQGSNQYNAVSMSSRTASGFVYYSGAIQNVESGGSMLDPVLFSGAIMNVKSTGMVSGGVVAANGYMYVSKGAAVSNATINSDGCVIVAEGSATGITVLKGGNVVADFNGYIAGTSDGSAFSIQATNTTEDFIVLSGYSQIVDQAKTALRTNVKSRGCQIVSSGGSAIGAVIYDGGTQIARTEGIASNTMIHGGYMEVTSGAIVSDTVIYSGYQTIYSNAEVNNAVLSGGSQYLYTSASAVGTLILSGYQSVGSFGSAQNTIIGAYGIQYLGNNYVYTSNDLSNYGYAQNTHVSKGGKQIVYVCGLADGTIVSSGGTLVLSNGSAVNVQHISGGVLSVDLSEYPFEIYDEWGWYDIGSSYAFASGTNEKGDFSVVSGTATNLILYEHASLYVGYGMSAIGTTISSGGILSVQNGGVVLSADIEAGGQFFCSSGGSFISGHVASGGLLVVSGTHVSGVTLDKGAEVRLDFNGEITGTSDGQAFHSSCGTVVSNFEVASGYSHVVSSGYRSEMPHILSGGVLRALDGATVVNMIQDSGAGLSASLYSGANVASVSGWNENGAFAINNGSAYNLLLNESSYLYMSRGAVVSSSTILGGNVQMVYATVSDILLQSGVLYAGNWWSGGANCLVMNITVGPAGSLYLYTGASIEGDILVDGTMYCSGSVLAKNGADVTIQVNRDSHGYISNFSNLPSNISFSIHAESGLNGRYSLTNNLPETIPAFHFLIDGAQLNDLSIGQSVFYEGARYTLTKDGTYLYLDVTANVSEESVLLISGENVSYCGPVANDMRIVVGETQLIKKDGSAVNTLVDFGGTQDIESGGLANRTTVMSGGQLYVRTGANATSATILAGGSTEISQGGSASFLNVMSGGMAEAAGTVDYAEISESGLLHLVGGAVLTGTITVSGRLTADSVISANGTRLMLNLNKETACLNQLDSFAGAYIVLQVSAGETGSFKISDAAPADNMALSVSGMSLSTATGEAVYRNNYRYQFVSDADGLNLEIREVHTDFEVSDFIAPTVFVTGETVSFNWNLTNNGEMPLDGVWQSVYLVDADDPTRKTLLKSVYLSDLPEFGETVAQTMDVLWKDNMGYANSLFQVVVEADGDIQPNDNMVISTSQYHFEQKLSIEKLPDSFTENTGRIRVVAKRTGSPDRAVSATIVSDDSTGLLSVPETVSFAAGESEKVFYLTVGDNAEYQGDRNVRISLQADGYQSYMRDIVLTDDEIPQLSLEVVADEVTEGESFASFGTVKLNTSLDHDLRVKLTYDKAQLSGIPDYVVIKAGQTETQFAMTVLDDATSEIDKTIKITASADGVASGNTSLLVKDNDIPAIALSVDKSVVSENAGVYALVGTITRTDDTVNYVKVKFTVANNSGLILPSTVTLGTGEKSVNYYIGIKDNSLVDGDRVATVNASIYIDSCGCTVQPVSGETQVSFTILDEDGEALGLSLSRSNVAENTTSAARLTITRNTVNGDALTVNLNVAGSALLDLPETVQFAAGENSVTIDVNTLTDGINTGNQMTVITASAEGYASAVGYLNISDVDLPDFEVSNVSVGESQVYAGKSTLVNLTLLNSGFQAHSGSVNVKLTLSDGTELGTYKVNGPFEVGGTKEVSFYVNMPEIVGSRTISAVVDPDNHVSELNKGNNTGVSAAFEVKLDYIVTVETEPEVLYTKAPITISGTTRKLNGDAVGNMPVEVMLKALTGEKIVKAVSDAEGNYTLTLDTSDLYAGSYSVYAGNLGGFGQAQDRVEIAGMKVNQSKAFTWDVENLTATEGSFTISNLSGVALSGVAVRAVNAPDNFVFVSDAPAALDANGQLTVNYTITAAGETEGNGYELTYGWQKIDFVAESEEGVTAEFSGYFYSNPQTAVLTLSETQDVRTLYSGGEYYYEFRITNTGYGDTGEIELNLPANDLVKLISNPVIENLAYGESATVTLKINPTALNGLELNAPYTGSIGISAENANATGFDFGYTFVTNDTGNITITMTDEWTQYAADRPMLSGAKVGVYNAYTNKLVATGYSDENGTVSFSDLAEGKYLLKYSADKHNNAQEIVTVRGGETLELNTFLQVSTVKYTWDVRKVELTDTYEIVLSTEFETNVPAPVVTIDGPTVLPELAWGESTLMNFTVTNHGLIAAQNFTFELPSIGNGYSWRVLNDQPFDIAPNSIATITVLLERNTYTDSNGTVYVCKDGVFRSSQDGKVFYAFNEGGNISKIIYEDSSTEEFEYDEYGRKTSYVDRNGEKTWYFYTIEGNTVEWRNGMPAPIDVILPETTSLEAGETAEIIVSVWNSRAENEEGIGYLLLKSDKDISMIAGNGASGDNQMFFLTSDQNSTWGERNEYTVYVTNHSEESVDLADLVISNGFTSDLTDENPFDVSMISGERPDSVSDETWNAYLNALSEYVGTSWASYQERLNEVISICEQTETKITDTDYYNYLIQTVAYYNSILNETGGMEKDSNLPENTLTACNGYVNLKYYVKDGVWENLNLSTSRNSFDKQNKTIVLIHGWNNTYDQDWLTKIADELRGITGYNILSVDWDKWANTMYAGATLSVVADGVNRLLSDLGVTPDLVIGHSFGAHIGGMIEGGTHIALDLADDWGLSFIPQIVSLKGSDSELADFAAFCSFVNLTPPLNKDKRLENLTNRYYKQYGDNKQEWPTEIYEQYEKDTQIVLQFAEKEKKDFYDSYWKTVSELAENVFKRERIDTLYKSSWIAGTEERLGKYNYLLTRGKKLTLVARLLEDHSYAADGFLNILKLYQKEDKNEKIGIWYNHIVPTRLSTWHGIINGETGEFENLTVSDRLPYNKNGKTVDPFSIYEEWKLSGNLCDSNGNVLVEKKPFNLYLENKSNQWKDAAEYNGLFADICISRFEVCESSNNTSANNSNNTNDFSNKMISISMDIDDISNNYSYKYPFLSRYRCYVVYTYLSKDSTLNINEDVSLETENELRRVNNGTTTISISLNTPSFQSNKDFYSSLEKDGEYYKAYLFIYVKSVYSDGVIFREIHDEFELNPQDNIISIPSEIKIRFSPEAIINYTSNSPVISMNTVAEDVMYTLSGSSSPIMIDTVFSYLQPTIGGNQIYYSLDGEKSIAFNQNQIVSYQWYKANKSGGTDTYNLSGNEYSTEKVLSFECCSYDSSQMYVLKVTDSDGNFDYTAYSVIVGDYLFANAGEDVTYTVSVDGCSSDSIPLTIYLDGSNSSKMSKYYFWRRVNGENEYWLSGRDNTSPVISTSVEVSKFGGTFTYSLTTIDADGNESSPDYVTISVVPTNGTGDCILQTNGKYYVPCRDMEEHDVPHYIINPCCTDNVNSVALVSTNTTSSSGSVPTRTNNNNNSAGGGGFNSPSISTTCTTCKPYIASIPTAAMPEGGMMSAAAVLTASAPDGEPDSICAHVKMEFKQTAVMSREGFEGTLTLTNEAATEMTNVSFTATVLDSAGEDVSNLFEIAYNGADGFSITQDGDVESYGLGNNGTGTFTVLYVPGRYTATEGPEEYQFTGALTYTDSLVGEVSIDMTPITLTVNPSPSLQLHYFVERDVYADDPFTDAIEASIPAEISVLAVNAGKGDARNFSLSGLTPQIVDNQKGLLLNYTMTDAALNGVKNDNGIADVNFGTISAQSSSVAQWWYKTNVQGHYSDYSVNFQQMDYSYIDLYGNVRYVPAANRPDVSLIESADIHELIRSVQCGDDELPDFLVDDQQDDADTPDTLYLSTGAIEDVNAVFEAVSNGFFGTNDVIITLTADFAAGWNYLRILDPGSGNYELTGVSRNGVALNARNYWQTDRYYLDELGVKYEDRLHLLDYSENAGTAEYTLTYTARDKNPLAAASITGPESVMKTAVDTVTVTFNKAVNADTFSWEDIDLFRQGDLEHNLITSDVTITKVNDTTFEIGNLSGITGQDGYYQLIVRTADIADSVGNSGKDGKSLTWTMASAAPAVQSVTGIDDLMNGKSNGIEVVFSASIDASTLTAACFAVNGAAASGLTIEPVGESNTRFAVSGLAGLLNEGENTLEIDLTQIVGTNGNPGMQAFRREWMIDMTAPAVQQLSESFGLVKTAPGKLVFEASEEITVDSDAITLKKDGSVIASDSLNIAINGKQIIVTGINAVSDGAYELELALDKIADNAGNAGSGTAVKSWTIDRSAPDGIAGFSLAASCDLGESDSDGKTSTRDLTLVGTLPEAGLRVRIYQESGTKSRTLLRELTPDGTALETAVKVQSGHSVLVAELTDAAGNTSETRLSVFVDEMTVSAKFQEEFKEELSTSPEEITFELSEAVEGLSVANIKLSVDGTEVPLDGAVLVQKDELTYAVTGIHASANGVYTLSLDMSGLVKTSTGLVCSGTQSVNWTVRHAEAPTVVSSSIDSSQIMDGLAVFSIEFSTPMNCPELIESGAISHAVRIVEVDENNNVVRYISLSSEDFQYIAETDTLVWNSAAPLDLGGHYRLVLDTHLLKSEDGIELAGGSSSEQHSYQTSEETVLAEPTGAGTGTDPYEAPVWFDLNGDGKLDLIVGEKATDTEGKIRVLYNIGTTESPAFNGSVYLQSTSGDWSIAAANCLGVAPRFADVNGDGVADLVYGTSDGRIGYAVNNNGVFSSGTALLADGTEIDVGNRAVFDLVEWNGDGVLDIVSGAMDGKIYLFVNNGDWTFAAAQILDIQVENGWSAPAAVDLNDDGALDIVSGDGQGNLHWFLNNGDGTFTETEVSAGDSLRSRPFITDVNDDGIPDITVGYKNGKVSVLYGEKGGVVAEDFHINTSPVFLGTPIAAVDGYQVTISWEAASDDVGVSGYKVRIGDTEYRTTGTTLTLTDVAVGTYSYQIGAYDDAGLEGWSTQTTFTVRDITAPVLDGTSDIKIWKDTARLSWSPASDNVGIAGYRIEVNGTIYELASNITLYFLSGLDLGTYEYRIGAFDAAGLTTWSEKQIFTVTEIPDAEDHTLTGTVPTASYGPGCVAASIGMLLGYYDKFGYCGLDVSDLIPGEIELESRNNADALLNKFIASERYFSRFLGKTVDEERAWSLTDQNELNSATWDSLADWLGTGQKWRGNEDYATAYYYGSVNDIIESDLTYTVSGVTLPAKYADFKYGLSCFVESLDYMLDGDLTRTVKADALSDGSFSFADFVSEIDAGRGVLISLTSPGNLGHMVLGYGYNEATREIIFDDTSAAGQRMVWNGSYTYAGHKYTIQSVTTVVFDKANLNVKSDVAPQTWIWDKTTEATQYIVEYSTDDFIHVVQLVVDSNSLDSFQMPAGNYQMRVKPAGGEWTLIEPVVVEETDKEPKLIKSNADGNADVFFANPIGTWEAGYLAQHVGSTADAWGGTKEYATLFGKNKLADIIEGSTDANILLMTDEDNGDGLFVDDIYSALPGSVTEQQARIAQIDEIRAGAGNDIVDMTSQRFAYTGTGLTIRGGAGNDTIWANKGDNFLFGDAGNDCIIGASGNDVIAGGIGNDRTHGGGGNDIFTFCDNWGTDEVEQLVSGNVTLWFASGDESKWDTETLTYTDGDNSVTVKGVASVTLKFGDDGSEQYATLESAGAFAEFTSQRIFEESGKGLLA